MKAQHTMIPSDKHGVPPARRGGVGLWVLAVAVLGSIMFSSTAEANGGQWGGPKTIRRAADTAVIALSADADQLVRL